MIGVNSNGGLGNQLFQFAFAYAAARRLKTSFFINDSPRRFCVPRYFELKRYGAIHNQAQRAFFYLISRGKFDRVHYDNWEAPSKNVAAIKNTTLYSGFFQSEDYFKDFQDEVRIQFKVQERYVREFKKKYHHFFENHRIIAVHIRRTDFAVHGDETLGGKNLCLPLPYYRAFLQRINERADDLVVFLGDDVAFMKENIKAKSNYVFEHNAGIIDFQILMHADILCISNSSFAWWAAYLNSKPTKTVFAPEYWMGFKIMKEHPCGVIVPDWNLLNVSAHGYANTTSCF